MRVKNISKYSQQANIRLTPSEKDLLEAKAAAQDMTLTKWARKLLLEAAGPTPSERRALLFSAMASEVTRLTIVAAQESEDISTAQSRDRIEGQARASAEVIVEQWLGQQRSREAA